MGKPVINVERAKHWMSVGAKASGTVHNLLVDLKAVSGKKINVLGKKTPIIKEVPAEDPKVAAAVETPAEAPAEVVVEAPVAEVAAEAAPEVTA
jgi:hypothetical protein